MNIRPLGNRIIVKPFEEEEITKAGIVLPDTIDKEKKAQGEIIAIGNGEKIQKLNLKVGDNVLYTSYAGSDIKSEDEEYKVLGEDEVLAVIEGQAVQEPSIQEAPAQEEPSIPESKKNSFNL
jgi:chaperonin GroES